MSPQKQQKPMQNFAVEVVRKLRERNFTAFFAGGCVRDRLLGRIPKDFDVATDAKPDEVREVFGRRRTIAVGASFGVITVLGPKPFQVEVATFRHDGHYSDGRHPDRVTFSTAEEDAARRDFTINGMFFDPINEQLIDFVGGEADLKSGTVRAIGDPQKRITEDRLRMLRAIRFAATYGFQIDLDTMAAIESHAAFLVSVSQERITAELMLMLAHENRSRALSLLRQSGLLPFVLPPFDTALAAPAWSRLLQILTSDSIDNEIVALSTILGEDGLDLAPSQVTSLARDLKLSNEQRNAVSWITSNRPQLEAAHQAKLSSIQRLLIQPQAPLAVSLIEAVAEVDGSPREAVLRCRAFLSQPPEVRDPAPLLRGDDLMRLGVTPGPDFARLLRAARDAQLDGLITTPDQAMAFVQNERAKRRD